MSRLSIKVDPAEWTSRELLDQISDKWSVLVLGALCSRPLRFNEIARELGGVTQKALSQCLKRLERNGIVERRVLSTKPVAVSYAITPLGRTLEKPLGALHRWAICHQREVELARQRFDEAAPVLK